LPVPRQPRIFKRDHAAFLARTALEGGPAYVELVPSEESTEPRAPVDTFVLGSRAGEASFVLQTLMATEEEVPLPLPE
jgi:hypothetical protein